MTCRTSSIASIARRRRAVRPGRDSASQSSARSPRPTRDPRSRSPPKVAARACDCDCPRSYLIPERRSAGTLRASVLRLDESAADRVADELDAVAHPELAQQVAAVRLDG